MNRDLADQHSAAFDDHLDAGPRPAEWDYFDHYETAECECCGARYTIGDGCTCRRATDA